MKKKRHLLLLIESEIRAIQLMYALEGCEIDFDLYLGDHSTLIFECMGIAAGYHSDELYSTYFSLVSKGRTIDLKNDRETLIRLTLLVYTYLLKYSELCAVQQKGKTLFATTLG